MNNRTSLEKQLDELNHNFNKIILTIMEINDGFKKHIDQLKQIVEGDENNEKTSIEK